jgi:hypothetical protein
VASASTNARFNPLSLQTKVNVMLKAASQAASSDA